MPIYGKQKVLTSAIMSISWPRNSHFLAILLQNYNFEIYRAVFLLDLNRRNAHEWYNLCYWENGDW